MIRSYTDHAANERTFLAWVRTGIAVIAFGFVVEKFNLFLLTMEGANPTGMQQRLLRQGLPGPLSRYDGFALILVGVALIVAATVRFLRTERLLNDPETHSAGSVRAELILSAALVLIVAGLSTYLVLN